MARKPGQGRSSGRRAQLGPYPMERLKRVTQPTTLVTGEIPRVDQRNHAFARGMSGDLGPGTAREFRRFITKHPLGAALAGAAGRLASPVEGGIAGTKAPLPEDPTAVSRHIKQLAYFLRADIVGICRLPQYAVYSHDLAGNPVELDHEYAISLVVDQDYDTFRGSTGDDWISGSQSFMAYATSVLLACVMADYIRRLGYPARAHHVFDYQVLIVPLLLLAGIGEICRAGLVLNPFLGTRFKAAVVTTDLPLEPDGPVDFGLQQFCRVCRRCANGCRPGAISDGEQVMINGYEKWPFEADRCSKYRIGNQGGSSCGRCIKVCPWNKPAGRMHDLARGVVKHAPFLAGLLIRMDEALGYGKRDERYKWWLDLEDVDGVLTVPGDRTVASDRR